MKNKKIILCFVSLLVLTVLASPIIVDAVSGCEEGYVGSTQCRNGDVMQAYRNKDCSTEFRVIDNCLNPPEGYCAEQRCHEAPTDECGYVAPSKCSDATFRPFPDCYWDCSSNSITGGFIGVSAQTATFLATIVVLIGIIVALVVRKRIKR